MAPLCCFQECFEGLQATGVVFGQSGNRGQLESVFPPGRRVPGEGILGRQELGGCGQYHIMWRTWLLIAHSDKRLLYMYYQFSLPHLYISLEKVGRMYFLSYIGVKQIVANALFGSKGRSGRWTRRWSDKWRRSGTWWTPTSRSSAKPSATSCPRPACT